MTAEEIEDIEDIISIANSSEYLDRIGIEAIERVEKRIQALKQSENGVIWRCIQNIQNIYGETIFTKGMIYQQVKPDKYPMMLVDNKIEETEVFNLKDYFTSI